MPLSEPLVFDLRITLDDQVRMNEWLLDQPELRRKRLLIRIMILVLVPPLGLVLGVGAATLQGGAAFWPALRDTAVDRGSLGIAGTVAMLMVLLWGGLRLLRRPMLRRRVRRLLPERPGIDRADPLLTEPARLMLKADGFVSETAASTTQVPWSAVKGLADAGTLLVLRTGLFTAFIIPKRDLTPAQDMALRDAVNANTVR